MRISRRNLLGLAGASAFALTPLACGNGGSSSGTSFAQPAGDVPDKYKDRLRVVIWFPYTAATGEAFTKLIQQFNDSQTDTYLEGQFQGTYDETAQKLATALQARQIPDMCIFSEVTWHKFHLNDTLEPLSDYFGDGLEPSDYVEPLIKEGTVKDQVWWVPFGRSTPLFYYNKDMFAAAGLPDRGPSTWDELKSWAPELVKVKTGGKSPKLHAYPQVDGDWMFQGAVWQFGGNYSKGLEVTIDQGGAVEAGEWQRKLVNEDKLAYMAKSPKIDFTNGLIATLQDSTGVLTGLLKDAKFQVGASMLPEQVAFGCPTGGGGISIMASAAEDRKKAAFEFLKFVAKPANVVQWCTDTGYLPSTTAAQETSEMKALFTQKPLYKVAVEQLAKTQAQDSVRLLVPNANRAIYTGLQKIWADNQPTQQVFSGVAEELKKGVEGVQKLVDSHS